MGRRSTACSRTGHPATASQIDGAAATLTETVVHPAAKAYAVAALLRVVSAADAAGINDFAAEAYAIAALVLITSATDPAGISDFAAPAYAVAAPLRVISAADAAGINDFAAEAYTVAALVLITSATDPAVIKVTDFNLARLRHLAGYRSRTSCEEQADDEAGCDEATASGIEKFLHTCEAASKN